MDEVTSTKMEEVTSTSIGTNMEEVISTGVTVADQQPLEEDINTTPLPLYQISEKVYARDSDGVLYQAMIRRQIYGPHYHRQVEMGLVSSMEEADKLLDDKNDMRLQWHYFVHFNKWNVKFDRWVSEVDVFALTDESTAYATRISTEHRSLHLQMRKISTKKKASQTVDGAVFLKEWKARMVSIDNDFKFGTSKFRDQNSKREDTTSRPTSNTPQSGAKANYWSRKRLVAECKLREQRLTEKRPSTASNTIILPFTLKKVIVQQWELINQCKMVSSLPAPTTIRQVLDMYLESKNIVKRSATSNHTNHADVKDSVSTEAVISNTNVESMDTDVVSVLDPVEPSIDETDREEEWNSMADGIAMLFDEILPSQLLYDEELVQHHVMMNHISEYTSLPDSEIYGCEHLVRLFVKLPEMLETVVDGEATRPVIAKVNDFIRFLDKNHGIVFVQSHRKLNELELKEQQKRLKLDDRKRCAPIGGSPVVESAKKKFRKTT